MNKITCFSGNSVGDTFAIQESNVGLSMRKTANTFAQDHSDLLIKEDVQIILESMKFGRNIYENMRKFIQY